MQIKYSVKTSAPAAEAPESAAPVYGFMPADVAAQAAVPSPTPAFWPEVVAAPVSPCFDFNCTGFQVSYRAVLLLHGNGHSSSETQQFRPNMQPVMHNQPASRCPNADLNWHKILVVSAAGIGAQ